MNQVLETVTNSLQELLGTAIKAIPSLLTALCILFLTRYMAQFMQKIAEAAGRKTLKSTSLQILLKKTTQVGVWTTGILLACVFAFENFSIGDIIATLGIGSVAIGFAFQDIFKNFLAGVILLIEEPFRIGDEIIVDSFQGKVEHISIRTTQIKTYEGEKVLIPNSAVFTYAVKVLTAYSYRRTDLAVGLDYNTSLPEAKHLLLEAITQVEGVVAEPTPIIDVVNFSDSAIDFKIRYWTLPEQKEVNQIKTTAIIAIKKACDAAAINIPYPIRTVYHYDQDKYNDYQDKELN
ncbi:Small-conductance mechanosensitive ion channel [Hyella patelloides LEGE 07179]|uniref:Small-conductance mechanosensitive ion channel n=1 Tax=Hyella patelloides LEGE 07179 TaxID=945734 RepID=A0A563VNL9_9CYAN|nr:mechanosensitive ion channel family protein [Hyella patelloides]VEP13060.1 Small-conductance mechanosensitive ion channel [Hyella patelloides LEGE 07179]